MPDTPPGITELLRPRRGALLALIGAGGKTTTMEQMGRVLAADGAVLLTTTTKIWPIEGIDTVFIDPDRQGGTILNSRTGPSLTVLARILGPDGKLHGVSPQTLHNFPGREQRVILCEADGAAGCSLKIHGDGEPVIPQTATHVLIVAGLDVIGRQATRETVHRLARYPDVTGGEVGAPVRPIHVARALFAARRLASNGARILFLLNKADLVDPTVAREVALELHRLDVKPSIFATSQGRVIQELS